MPLHFCWRSHVRLANRLHYGLNKGLPRGQELETIAERRMSAVHLLAIELSLSNLLAFCLCETRFVGDHRPNASQGLNEEHLKQLMVCNRCRLMIPYCSFDEQH